MAYSPPPLSSVVVSYTRNPPSAPTASVSGTGRAVGGLDVHRTMCVRGAMSSRARDVDGRLGNGGRASVSLAAGATHVQTLRREPRVRDFTRCLRDSVQHFEPRVSIRVGEVDVGWGDVWLCLSARTVRRRVPRLPTRQLWVRLHTSSASPQGPTFLRSSVRPSPPPPRAPIRAPSPRETRHPRSVLPVPRLRLPVSPFVR
ncbi:hypothetical protein DFH09DRAFT_1200828 [Mycena vulgaris]|nr:hypothetical protein DFH09DRAFT_1200828 [Mycena vulgaris]